MACTTCVEDSFERVARGLSAHAGVSRRFNLCPAALKTPHHKRLLNFQRLLFVGYFRHAWQKLILMLFLINYGNGQFVPDIDHYICYELDNTWVSTFQEVCHG